MDNTYLIEVTQAEKSAIVEALRRVRASSPLIEEIETLEPSSRHRYRRTTERR